MSVRHTTEHSHFCPTSTTCSTQKHQGKIALASLLLSSSNSVKKFFHQPKYHMNESLYILEFDPFAMSLHTNSSKCRTSWMASPTILFTCTKAHLHVKIGLLHLQLDSSIQYLTKATPFPYRAACHSKMKSSSNFLTSSSTLAVKVVVTSSHRRTQLIPHPSYSKIQGNHLHVYHPCDQPNPLSSLIPQTVGSLDCLIIVATMPSMAPWFTDKSAQVKCEPSFIGQSPILFVTCL
jgi:hypothetical protein